MGNRYIYNRHIAPITANARNGKGKALFTKTFQPERIDATTGRVISTGYTTLSEEEYRQLSEGSRTFAVYRDKHKLLVELDELPPEAKTPQEALVDARNEARKAVAQVSELTGKIAELTGKIAALEARLAETAKERDALKKETEALKAGAKKAGKDDKGKAPE
jgi:chromosome segregation ATPase